MDRLGNDSEVSVMKFCPQFLREAALIGRNIEDRIEEDRRMMSLRNVTDVPDSSGSPTGDDTGTVNQGKGQSY